LFQSLLIEVKDFYEIMPFSRIRFFLQNKELHLKPRKVHFRNHYQRLFRYLLKNQGFHLDHFLFQNSTILRNQVHRNIQLDNFYPFLKIRDFIQMGFLSHPVILHFEYHRLVIRHRLFRYHKFLLDLLLDEENYLEDFAKLNG
jgi:hypothetical protein